ncbi:MAG: bifunctional pyr operon transcriptional regulator/uracil phosphoribosyltransferase PyrR [Gammaproteobacteria bacterium]|nr:bifunctional pyr operon transcriptional regulator/uracil phosphoribosyltransferase PyrR [Gammaproteobacteria bacterium]
MTNDNEVQQLLDKIAKELKQLLQDNSIHDPLMIGIHSGGAWIAQQLHDTLAIKEPLGLLDISFYRDDFSRIGINPQVKPSKLPFSMDDRHIILVDDVLHTGRTIRAAMNELFDYGRPAAIYLVTLVERSGRELPIEANITGKHVELTANEHIKLNGPDNLSLSIQKV